jgi:hypothetical protein
MEGFSGAMSAAIHLLGYIDPGTGSLVIQVLAATLLSAGLFFKGLRERITMTVGSMFRSKKSADAATHEGEEHSAIAGQIGTDVAKRKAA